MDLDQLQESFDKFEFDPTQHTPEQLATINQAFQGGVLKNFKNVGQYESVRKSAQSNIAAGIEKAEETVPGINVPGVGQIMTERASYETAVDVAGSLTPYVMDRKKLIQAFDPTKSNQFGVNYRKGFAKTTTDMADKLSKIPFVKRFGLPGRLFARTVGALANAANKTDDFLRFGATQAARTELKSVIGGSLGAGAGSAMFDVVNNFQDDVAVGVQYDLADVSQKEIDALPPVQRTFAHSMEAMKNSLLWAGGMNAFVQTAGITAKAFAKFLTGTGTPQSKEIAEEAKKRGINLNLGQVANDNTVLGKFVKTYFETLGIMPGVSVVGRTQRLKQDKKVAESMFDFAENFAPVTTTRLLGYEALDVIDNNYVQFMNLIDESFKSLKNSAEKFDNPRMIPTNKLREMASNYMGELQSAELKGLNLSEDKNFQKILVKNQPINALYLKFGEKGIFDEKTFLTPLEFLQLRKDITAAVKASPNNRSILEAATGLRRALDQDFASVGQKEVQKEILEKSPFLQGKTFTNATEKDKFVKEQTDELAAFGKDLVTKFQMYSAITSPFESMTAKQLQDFGDYLFTAKSELGIKGKGKHPSEMFDTVITQILRDGSPEALNELRFLVGATDKQFTRKVKVKTPEGKIVEEQMQIGENFMNRLTSRFIYDAFFKSFARQPDEAVARNMDLFKKLQEQDMMKGTFADEILNATGTQDISKLKKIQAEKTMANNVERIRKDQIEVDLAPDKLGEFEGVEKLRQNLGLTKADGSINQAGREKLEILFGTGQKGKDHLNDLEKFLDTLDTHYSQAIGDSSKFLTRRIGLVGLSIGAGTIGALTGGIGVGFTGLILTPLLLRGAGKLIADPKYMKALLDVYTPDERYKMLGKLNPLEPLGKYLSPSKRRSLGILLNYFKSDEDEVDVDPAKMTAEQIRDYLFGKKTLIDNTSLQMSDLPPNMKKRMFPDAYLYERASLEDKAKYDEMMRGGMNALAFTNAVEDADNEQAAATQQTLNALSLDAQIRNPQRTGLMQMTPTQQTQPEAQPTQPTQPTGTQMNRQGLFATLFPNDPYGNLLAQGRQNA